MDNLEISTMNARTHLIILLFILGIAFFIRVLGLGQIPVGQYVDEIAITLDSHVIAQTGKDMHGRSFFSAIIPSYGDYKLPVYIWFSSLTTLFFGAGAFATRLPSAIAGTTTVLLVYLISKRVFSLVNMNAQYVRAVSTISASVVAFSPWSFLFSRTGFEGHLAQSIVLLGILFALHASKKWWYSFISVGFGALAVYTYYSVRFVFPVLFLGAIGLQINRMNWKKILFTVGVTSLAVFFLLLIPMTKSEFYAPSQTFRLSSKNVLQDFWKYVEYSNELREVEGYPLWANLFHHRLFYLARALAINYSGQLDLSYLFFTGDPNLRHGTGVHGVFLWPMFPAFFAGWYVLFKKHFKMAIYFLLWWLFAILPASVPVEIPHALRSLNAFGMLSIVVSLGFYELYLYAQSRKFFRIGFMIWIAIILFVQTLFFLDYVYAYPSRSAKWWADGMQQLARFVVENAQTYDRVIIAGDEKAFLWVLSEGKYPAQEIQNIPSVKFRKQTFRNMSFGIEAMRDETLRQGSLLFIGLIDELPKGTHHMIDGIADKGRYGYMTKEELQDEK
ncbi:MAG TPA: hypothetical protein DCW55_03370 [Candidatus Pacebacteria bacterium]|nr:hypothetical protein [Candidatus Paceibacterota bacterium]HAX01777.1 hypothetical protein [Candidatus Paceibacterota bacterium]